MTDVAIQVTILIVLIALIIIAVFFPRPIGAVLTLVYLGIYAIVFAPLGKAIAVICGVLAGAALLFWYFLPQDSPRSLGKWILLLLYVGSIATGGYVFWTTIQ